MRHLLVLPKFSLDAWCQAQSMPKVCRSFTILCVTDACLSVRRAFPQLALLIAHIAQLEYKVARVACVSSSGLPAGFCPLVEVSSLRSETMQPVTGSQVAG